LGKQIFELSNHLGNVLATITDKKLQVSTNTTSTAYFEADLQTVQDYYAFGMQMPGRKLSGGYRYGFNGKENDNEVKGEGNQQDYGMRIYDGRIGKFLSVDPLIKSYPELTPYQFASNSPISGIDLDGLEWELSTVKHNLELKFQLYNHMMVSRYQLTSIGPATPTRIPENVRVHNEYTNPTIGKLLFKPGYAVNFILYSLYNDCKILGSAIINGGRNATDAVGNSTSEKQRLFAFVNASTSAFGLGEFAAAKFATAEGNALISKATKDGVKVIVAETSDDIAYLKAMQSQALYMGGEGNSGSILVMRNAPRSHVLEEVIHHNQRKVFGDDYFQNNIAKLEVEAQDQLLQIGKKEGWSTSELDEIQRAKNTWTQKLKEQSKQK